MNKKDFMVPTFGRIRKIKPTKDYEVKQLTGIEQKRFVARCLIRKYADSIQTLRGLKCVQILDEKKCDLVIKLVKEMKDEQTRSVSTSKSSSRISK